MSEILIYDPIGPEELGWLTPKAIKDQLDALNGEERITVRIHSPGGDVFDGFAIYNLLVEHPAKIDVKVDGLAGSIASVVAMAGDTIDMAANAQMMIHNPFSMRGGEASFLRDTADRLDALKQDIITAYRTKVGKTNEEVAALMSATTWIRAKDAVSEGWATSVRQTGGKNVSQYNNFFMAWMLTPPADEQPAERADPPMPEYRIAARARFPIS